MILFGLLLTELPSLLISYFLSIFTRLKIIPTFIFMRSGDGTGFLYLASMITEPNLLYILGDLSKRARVDK